MNSGILFIGYWNEKLRIKNQSLHIDASRITHFEHLAIEKIERDENGKDFKRISMDNLDIIDGDCSNLFKKVNII